jgi:hypothetical protein
VLGLNGVVAVETGEAETPFSFEACGFKHPGEAQIAKTIQAEKVLDLIDGILRGNELSPGWKIDPVVAGIPVRWTANQHMDLPGPRLISSAISPGLRTNESAIYPTPAIMQ